MIRRFLVALSFPATLLYGQAAAEYAMRSSGSAMSQSAGHASIGACRIDGGLLSCLGRTYPRTALVLALLLCLLALRKVFALTR